MAYTKKFEVKVDGTKLLWLVDMDSEPIKLKDAEGFELDVSQLSGVIDLVMHIANQCKMCPDVKSMEFSTIEE